MSRLKFFPLSWKSLSDRTLLPSSVQLSRPICSLHSPLPIGLAHQIQNFQERVHKGETQSHEQHGWFTTTVANNTLPPIDILVMLSPS